MRSISSFEAKRAFNRQIKWENMLRPGYCRKGRDFVGVPFPVIYVRDVVGMTKDDILQGMKKMDAEISYPTLNRYVNAGMVTKPENVNKGRGKGQISQYPERALLETYAAWSLQNGPVKMDKEKIQQARVQYKKYIDKWAKPAFVGLWARRIVIAYIELEFKDATGLWEGLFGDIRDSVFRVDNNFLGETDIGDTISKSQEVALGGIEEHVRFLMSETKTCIRVFQKKNGIWTLMRKADIASIFDID